MNKSVKKSVQTIRHNVNTINTVMKANEGDKRVIFGKPSTFSGGEWHADEGGQQQDQIDEATEFGQAQDEVDQFNTNMEQALTKLTPEERAKAEERFGLKPSTPEEDQSVIDNKLTAMEGVLQSMGIDTDDTAGEFEKQFGINPLENENATPEKIKEMMVSGNEMGFGEIDQEDHFDDDQGIEPLEGLGDITDFPVKKDGNMDSVKKSVDTINKNLAGVHDALQKNGVTSTNDDHSHSYLIDRDGNGATTGMVGESAVQHIHEIKNYEVSESQNHTHYI